MSKTTKTAIPTTDELTRRITNLLNAGDLLKQIYGHSTPRCRALTAKRRLARGRVQESFDVLEEGEKELRQAKWLS